MAYDSSRAVLTSGAKKSLDEINMALGGYASSLAVGWFLGVVSARAVDQRQQKRKPAPTDWVVKNKGDYIWRGVLCGTVLTPAGDERVVVAHQANRGWVLHIYRPDQIVKL